MVAALAGPSARSPTTEGGNIDEAVYQRVDDPDDVTVIHDFNTLDEARAFTSNPELKEKMDALGVTGTPQIWFTERAWTHLRVGCYRAHHSCAGRLGERDGEVSFRQLVLIRAAAGWSSSRSRCRLETPPQVRCSGQAICSIPVARRP